MLPFLRQRPPTSFVGTAGASLVLRAGGMVLQFITSVLTARLLGVEGFGVYAYVFAIANLIGWPLSLGLGTLAEREVPRAVAQGNWAYLRGYLRVTFAVLAGATAVLAILAWGLEASGAWDPPLPWLPVVAAAAAQGLLVACGSILNGLRRLLASQVLDGILKSGLLLAVVAILAFLNYPMTPAEAVWLGTLSNVLVLPLMLGLIWRTVRSQMPRPMPAAELTPLLWLGAALPVLLDGLAYQFQANLGVLMLGSQADEAAVAALRVASRAVELVLLINVISMQVLGPMLSAALAREAYDEAQRFVSQSALVAAGLGLAIYAALGIWGEAYLDLFGPGFEEGLAALRILIVAHALSMVAGPTSIMLMMLNRQRLALALTLASLGLNYVLSVLLIPPLGLEGAAIAAAASWVFLKALQLAAILLLSPLDPTPFGIARRLGWRPRA